MEVALNSSVLDGVILAVEQTTATGDYGITSATRLADDLQLGRFGLLKLALSLEEVFEIELPDETLKRFSTIGDIVKYLNRHYFQDTEFPARAGGLAPELETDGRGSRSRAISSGFV